MAKAVSRTAIAVLLLMQFADLRAADASFFAARRRAVMGKIPGSVAVLQGSPDTRAYVPFRQNNDFYYLTGVETPGAFLLLDASKGRSILFLPPRDERLERWEGPRLYPGKEAREAIGFDEVLEASELQEELRERSRSSNTVYTPLRAEERAATSRDRAELHDSARLRSPWDGRTSRSRAFAEKLAEKLKTVKLADLSPILDELRRVKDAQEIERLREAGRIGALGLKEAIGAVRPGLYEYQAASVAEYSFKWNGAMGYAFFPIVGSGPNSCVVHYTLNSRRMEAGDLVVIDFGPDYRYYQSDISRTVPVSGTFSEEQAKVYQIVLDAQKAALAKVRPGASFSEITDAARDVIARFGYARQLTHGVSHYIGMSTHDVGDRKKLEPGVVVTVEPGIYLPEKQLGVRIEDVVLVTREGCEVLTGDVPKEIPEIESLMSGK